MRTWATRSGSASCGRCASSSEGGRMRSAWPRPCALAAAAVVSGAAFVSAAPAAPVVLVNHVGYELGGPKRAVVQGHQGDDVRSCAVVDAATGSPVATEAPRYTGPVARWRDWVYWTLDFSSLERAGAFRVACATGRGEVTSATFRVEKGVLERHTLSDVLYYFKGQRSSGPFDAADRAVPLEARPE